MYSCMLLTALLFCISMTIVESFIANHKMVTQRTFLKMADVEITFPNNKKVKVPSGSALKEAAKKAGFSPNYGCEEGKCGSCEMKVNGKTKVRPCIGKVPAGGPIKLENL